MFTSPEELREALEKEGYVIGEDLAGIVWTAINVKPVGGAILGGPPGVGKSSLAATVSKVLGYRVLKIQVFPGMPDESLFVRHTVDEKGNVVAVEGILVEAAKLSHKDKVTVILEEAEKGRPSLQVATLDFLQYGTINYLGRVIQANLSNILFFITTNDYAPLLEPLTRRLPRIDIPPMSPELLASLLRRDGFSDREIGLGIKLYLAGFEANLSRPITYQELSQFLTALRLNPRAKLVDYIRVYLIKDGELNDYLYALKNLPEEIVLDGEENSRREEQELREAIKSPLVVRESKEEEPSGAEIEYPEVIIRSRKRPEVYVRVLDREKIEVKTGYFKANDYVYDALNRSGIEFSVVEVQGGKYVFLRKRMDKESVEKFLENAKEHKRKIEGEFLYVQDLYIGWERFKKEFDLKEYISYSSHSHIKPLLLYRGGEAIRVDFRDGENSLADVLFYNSKGRAMMEVHVKEAGHNFVLEKGAVLFLFHEVAKWKKESEKKQAEMGEKQSQGPELEEVLIALKAMKKEVNGKSIIVIPTEEYALEEDDYEPIKDDILIETELRNIISMKGEDMRITARVYLPTFLRVSFPLRVNGREILSDAGIYPAVNDYVNGKRRYYIAEDYMVMEDLNLPLTEDGLKEALKQVVKESVNRFVLPLLEYLKERQRIREVKESVEEKKEDILLGKEGEKSARLCRR